MATAAVQRYWRQILPLGCMATEQETLQRCGRPAEIAHCHGGSIVERMQEPKVKGKKVGRYDWLVLPLCPEHGREGMSNTALDAGVERWEAVYGPQVMYLDQLIVLMGIDVWVKAQGTKQGVRHPWRTVSL